MIHLFTEIVSADIFRGSADIVRKGSVTLPAGTAVLCVHGLPDGTEADTVRLFGEEGVRCRNLRFEVPCPKDDEAGEEDTRLRDEIARLRKEAEARELQEQLWQQNGDFTGRTAGSVAEVEEYIEKLPARLMAIHGEIRELEKKIEELEKQQKEAEEKASLPAALLEVTAEREGEYSFELRYHEERASWEPFYEIHSDGEGPLEIRMRARIAQTTAEDWKGTGIRLYDGNPASGSVLPDVNPSYLDIREPAQHSPFMGMGMQPMMMASRSAGAGPMGAAMTEDALELAPAPKMNRMETDEAETGSGDSMTEYLLPGKKDIPKGTRGTMADLRTVPAECIYRLACVPAASPCVFMTAKMKTEDLPFTGEIRAAIYHKGIYSGTYRFAPDPGDEWQGITLGREDRIRVSRKTVSKKTSTTLLRGQKVVAEVYEMKITNGTDAAADITVKDQVPVSRNKEITVEVEDMSGAKQDASTGILTWDISVAAGESRTIRLAYKVISPKDKAIVTTHEQKRPFCPECGTPLHGEAYCPECGARIG